VIAALFCCHWGSSTVVFSILWLYRVAHVSGRLSLARKSGSGLRGNLFCIVFVIAIASAALSGVCSAIPFSGPRGGVWMLGDKGRGARSFGAYESVGLGFSAFAGTALHRATAWCDCRAASEAFCWDRMAPCLLGAVCGGAWAILRFFAGPRCSHHPPPRALMEPVLTLYAG